MNPAELHARLVIEWLYEQFNPATFNGRFNIQLVEAIRKAAGKNSLHEVILLLKEYSDVFPKQLAALKEKEGRLKEFATGKGNQVSDNQAEHMLKLAEKIDQESIKLNELHRKVFRDLGITIPPSMNPPEFKMHISQRRQALEQDIAHKFIPRPRIQERTRQKGMARAQPMLKKGKKPSGREPRRF